MGVIGAKNGDREAIKRKVQYVAERLELELIRMYEMGIPVSEMDISYENSRAEYGWGIKVRRKRDIWMGNKQTTMADIFGFSSSASSLVAMLQRVFGIDKAQKIIDAMRVQRDISPHIMSASCGLSDKECQELYTQLNSLQMLAIYKNYYHCTDAPICSVKIEPGKIMECPNVCEECQEEELGDGDWLATNMYLLTKEAQELL